MSRSCRIRLACVVAVLVAVATRPVMGQRLSDFTTPRPLPEGETLIIGFLGGRDRWNDDRKSIRKLALKLRASDLPSVHVETVENLRRGTALKLVRQALDRDGDGQLDQRERQSARIILYGQSFGGAAVVKFARQLNDLGVPILLTVQVDSVGWGDAEIPPNVARAANLYQRNGRMIHGEAPIRAVDPKKTVIVGNFEFDYANKPIDLSDVSWFKRLFRVAHTKMEHDPDVWAQVETLILAELRGLSK